MLFINLNPQPSSSREKAGDFRSWLGTGFLLFAAIQAAVKERNLAFCRTFAPNSPIDLAQQVERFFSAIRRISSSQRMEGSTGDVFTLASMASRREQNCRIGAETPCPGRRESPQMPVEF